MKLSDRKDHARFAILSLLTPILSQDKAQEVTEAIEDLISCMIEEREEDQRRSASDY